jgi:hypothetical protein
MTWSKVQGIQSHEKSADEKIFSTY